MKIINKKGILFGLINITDLLVLLMILAVLVWGGKKLLTPAEQVTAKPTVVMTTTLRVVKADPQTQAAFQKEDLVGQKLREGSGYLSATIQRVQIEDNVQQVMTADGRIVNAKDGSAKDIVLVITSSVEEDTPVPEIGEQQVRAGRGFFLKTDGVEATAIIQAVTFQK